MTRLSNSIADMKDHYTVVVVGSGYGGAIAASRCARAGQSVCVLERGRELVPGEFPDTFLAFMRELHVDWPGHPTTRESTRLYDFRVNDDLHVLTGCGLGGTSLINANVALRADPRVFQHERWPQALRSDLGAVEDGYARAIEMLKPAQYPTSCPELPKLAALEKAAAHLGKKFVRAPINVNFAFDGANHVGVEQHRCTYCGDCVAGCNYGAKNTTAATYLPDAKNFGAEIFTCVSVRTVERADPGWAVHYRCLETGRDAFGDEPLMTVTADVVLLAAGSLGSTEILLRSRDEGLPLSGALGEHFTGNGDVLAFAYNNDQKIRAVGFGHRPPSTGQPVGPCIAGVIDARDEHQFEDGMVIEEGVIPGAIASVVMPALTLASGLAGEDTDEGVLDEVEEDIRELESLVGGPYAGAAQATQTFLVNTHDDGVGKLELRNDRVCVAWPGVGNQPAFKRVDTALRTATAATGGTYLANPLRELTKRHELVTVHPLGGCAMADDASGGVVNHKGQVFAGAQGTGVYEGLYVCDGAIVPRPLGVNPLLTISALAERCCALLASDRGWTIDYRLPSAPHWQPPSIRPGLRFTETMRGRVALGETEDFAGGEETGGTFELKVTILSDDLRAMLASHDHEARIIGTVLAPTLSAEPLTVTHGRFRLLVDDHCVVGEKRIAYNMRMTATDGRRFTLEGHKILKDDPGLDEWSDTTTLYTTIYEEKGATTSVLGKGILRIGPEDFFTEMQTVEITNAGSVRERLEAKWEFGKFFAGALFEVYGGLFRPARTAQTRAPRRQRPLRAPHAPEVHHFATEDGVRLRLTRYNGERGPGAKGPVIIAPGFGTSTLALRLDTIHTNLTEYLCAHGYDVWLFDYRASPDLPASRTQFTLDDIALNDWPAAVKTVRDITGSKSVQALGHCVGSLTLAMSLLSDKTDLQGKIRSAILSQSMPYVSTGPLVRLKSWLRLADVFDEVGIEYLDTDYKPQLRRRDAVFDKLLRLYPSKENSCENPNCRRVLFLYGDVFRHTMLNNDTHDDVYAMFGMGNITAFKHLSVMVRRGKAVDARGEDAYVPHVAQLKDVHVALLQGEKNRLFTPRGSRRTYDWLCQSGATNCRLDLIPNYGHMDCFIGRRASRDVFPTILRELEF